MRRSLYPVFALFLVTASLSGCIFSSDEEAQDEELLPVIKFTPSNNRVGDIVYFDASSSTPSDGSLSYRWDFDSDGSIDETGRTAEWTFQSAGKHNVTLTISDGSRSKDATKTLTIAEEGAEPPTASITCLLYTSDAADE